MPEVNLNDVLLERRIAAVSESISVSYSYFPDETPILINERDQLVRSRRPEFVVWLESQMGLA